MTKESGLPLEGEARTALPSIALGAAALAGLYAASLYSYLLFHCLAEGFSIAVACGVFMLAWNSRHILDNDYLLLLGIAFPFIAAVDLVHTFAYTGMGVFRGHETNLPAQLWIAARYLQALTFLAAPMVLKARLRPRWAIAGYAAATGLLLAAVFRGVFPDCFIEGKGLTPFKVASEYIICALFAGAALLLYRNRSAFGRDVLRLLIASILVSIGSEMSFTLYADPYGFFNLLGHFLKLVSFYLIYRAVIVTGLRRPYDLLYRRLSESEEKYRQLFQHMPLGFGYFEIITDPAGVPVDCIFRETNETFEKLTGLKADAILGRRVTEAVPGIEHVKPDLIKSCGDVALGGGVRRLEVYSDRLKRHYGVLAYSPRPRHFVAFFQDVTERKRSDERLRASRVAALNLMEDAVEARRHAEEAGAALAASEERLRLALEAAYLISFEWDIQRDEVHRFVSTDPALPPTLGQAPGTFEGVRETVHPEDRALFDANVRAAMEREDGRYESEHRIVRPDGEVAWLYERGRVDRDPQGRPSRLIGLVQDITGRKRAGEALAESEGKYRELVETANSIILRWDHQGRIRFVNEYGLRFFGYSEEELIGKDVMTIVPKVEESTGRDLEALVRDILMHPEEHTYVPNENIRRDGETVWVVWANKAITDEEGNVREILAIGNDITELKRAEERIKASLAEKEVLLKEIHHRVKNNMQVVSSLISLQAEEISEPSLRAPLRDMSHRVRSMAMVHEKLYESADLGRVDFDEYARSLLDYLWRAHGTEESGVRLVLDLEPIHLPVNTAVPCGLVLNELVSNALKHAFRGRAAGEVAVSLRSGAEGEVEMCVRDNGSGLPAEVDWRRGPSLGLRLVHMLAGQLRAALDVSSGGGTRFTLTIKGPKP